MKKQLNLYLNMLQSIPEGIVILDPLDQFKVNYANKSVLSMYDSSKNNEAEKEFLVKNSSFLNASKLERWE